MPPRHESIDLGDATNEVAPIQGLISIPVLTPEIHLPVSFSGDTTGSSDHQQPLRSIYNENLFLIHDDDGLGSLTRLEFLIKELRSTIHPLVGRSPGFATCTDELHDVVVGRIWRQPPTLLAYEILQFYEKDKYVVPIPPPAAALHCLERVALIWKLRLASLQCNQGVCSCIAQWDFVDGCILFALANQTMEQIMVEESSAALNNFLDVERWNQMYAPGMCPDSNLLSSIGIPRTPIKLLRNRDQYLSTIIKFALASRRTIQISTCYLFAFDPAHRYVLLDVLPYMIRTYGVKVQVMIDLMTVESGVLRSVLHPLQEKKDTARATGGITSRSFIQSLPNDAPVFSQDGKESTLSFLSRLLELAGTLEPLYEVRWWCARDSVHKYRIKNHSKCTIFDNGQVAVIGGSNLCPTVASSTSDLDALLAGEAAKQVQNSFDILWKAMDNSGEKVVSDDNTIHSSEHSLQSMIDSEDWTDHCNVAIVRSEPTSFGEDNILRIVLATMSKAKSSIIISMGHANIPIFFAEAVAAACERGVKVSILVNSFYSNDLRTGQRDLFLSIRDLLQLAPSAEVYCTAPAELRGHPTESARPLFLHGKYVVIDSLWCALGSWNLWTRAAFHEIEHEAILESTAIAEDLTTKFQQESALFAIRFTPSMDCFVPTGCQICEGYGPFFRK